MTGQARLWLWLAIGFVGWGCCGLHAQTPSLATDSPAKRVAKVLAALKGELGASLGPCELSERLFEPIWPEPAVWLGIYGVEIDGVPLAGGVVRALLRADGTLHLTQGDVDLAAVCSLPPDKSIPKDPCPETAPCRSVLYWRQAGQKRELWYWELHRGERGGLRNHSLRFAEDDPSRGESDRLPWHSRWAETREEIEPESRPRAFDGSVFPYTFEAAKGDPPTTIECPFEPASGEGARPGDCHLRVWEMPGTMEKLRAPSFDHDDGGWKLKPLGDVWVVSGKCRWTTEPDGDFCWPHNKEIQVPLENERFKIHALEALENTVEKRLTHGASPVMVKLNDSWRELEVGAVAYRNLRKALRYFDALIPLPATEPGQDAQSLDGTGQEIGERLAVFQTVGISGANCLARWMPGEIHLPLLCRTETLFEPKGLCPEVVAHEVAHQVLVRAVDLAENRSYWDVMDRFLGEELADFFAMASMDDPTIGAFCSNELRSLAELEEPAGSDPPIARAPVSVEQHDVTRALWRLAKARPAVARSSRAAVAAQEPGRLTQIPRLLLATILWGGEASVTSVEGLGGHLSSLIEEMKLPDTQKKPMLESLGTDFPWGHFFGAVEAIRRGRSVSVYGSYRAGPECRDFELSIDSGESWQEPPGDASIVERPTLGVFEVEPGRDLEAVQLRPRCDPKADLGAPPVRTLAVVTDPGSLESRAQLPLVTTVYSSPKTEVQATEDPALTWRDSAGRPAALEFDRSRCRAAPTSRVLETPEGERVVGLSCDGWLKSAPVDLSPEPDPRAVTERIDGLLDLGVEDPIQVGNTDGLPGDEIIVGPFEQGQGDSTLLELRILGADGSQPRGLRRLLIRAVPMTGIEVGDFDGDNCDEVALKTEPIRIWDPNEGLESCQPEPP